MTIFQRLRATLSLFFSEKKRFWRLMALGACASAGFILPAVAHAGECGLSAGGVVSCIAMIFVWIFQILTALMGYILILEVGALIQVAQYFNFVSPGPTVVRIGWVVTRDLANMFFIVFLLIIAFSTVVGIAKYHYEKTLKTLLIMAVVINFSKTICGLLIDASQVLMLSFVNGFKSAAAGNFLNAFQISKLLRLADGQSGYDFGLVLAMMLAFVLAAISACVVLVLLVMMVFRVIMLWILIILSPIAFLTAAFPMGGNYYADWWSELKKYLIGGPVIAFFLWLALATAQQTGGNLSAPSEGWGVQSTASSAEIAGEGGRLGVTNNARIPSEAGRTDTILSMVIAICILFAGLKFASNPAIGGMAAGFAGKVNSKAKAALKGATMYGLKRTAEPFVTGGGKALAKVPLIGGAGRYMAMTGEKWKKDRMASREKLFGSPEDMARLSPGAFARKVGGLKDPKEIDRFMKAASSNPKMMAALVETKESINPLTGEKTKRSAAKDVLTNLINAGKGTEAAKLASSDKRLSDLVKNDPELLKSMYGGVKDAAAKDPNLGKDLGAFEQKFLVPLQKNGLFGNIPSVVNDKLKTLAPKISSEDVAGLDQESVKMLLPHLNSAQARQIMQGGKADQLLGARDALGGMSAEDVKKFLREKGGNAAEIPASWYANQNVADFALASTSGNAEARGKVMADATRAQALQEAATRGLAGARTGTDESKIAAAAVQALSVGALTATQITGDAHLSGILGRSMDTSSLNRNVNKDDASQVEAAQAAMRAVMAQDPARVRNLSKNDLYSKILPSKQEIDAAVAAQTTATAQTATQAKAAERTGLASQAVNVQADLSSQLQDVQDAIAADQAAGHSTTAREQVRDQTAKAMRELTVAMDQRGKAEQELTRETARLAQVRAAGGNTSGLERVIESLKKGIQSIDSNLAKQVAAAKGITFNDNVGGANRRNRNGGGGGTNP